MTSDGKKTKAQRRNKKNKQGKIRKHAMGKASTPAFPIHVPDHDKPQES